MRAERVVLDTNVLIGAALTPGKSFQVLQQVLQQGAIIFSEATFEELTARLMQPKFDRYVGRERRRQFLDVLAASTGSLKVAHKAGIRMAYGTYLLGELHRYQTMEFALRSEVLPALEIVRSATVFGGEALGQEGRLGVLAEGAHADLLVLDGNPLANLELLQGQVEHLSLIVKGGRVVKNTLPS